MDRKAKANLIAASAIIVLIVAAGLKARFAPTPKPPLVATTELARAPDLYGGCLLRGLDNQSLNFAGLVKQRLRNPESFVHVRTTPGEIANGSFPVSMTYRGTNGFGAVDTDEATGEIRVADCAAKVISMD